MEITYNSEFNLALAEHHDILQKLRSQNIECHIFIDEKHNIITLWPKEWQEKFKIINILNIPENAYELDNEMEWIVVDIPLLL